MKKNLIISIQQPEFLPWIGFFNKVVNVDEVVILDNVQFKKRYFENRIKIRNYSSWQWITVPVKTKGKYLQKISEVEIDNTKNWQENCLRTIELNYKKAPYFSRYFPAIEKLFKKRKKGLSEFNIDAIKALCKLLGLEANFYLASNLKTKGSGSQLILDICKRMKTKGYLSGKFGRDYLAEKDFRNNSVEVFYQNFKHPEYIQFHGKFIEGLSVIDLLFNEGDKSLQIIKKGFTLKK